MGQDEDYSPGDSISPSSEKLLQRGRGRERSVLYLILVKRVSVVRHTFWLRLTASHEEQMSPLMILALF